MKKIILLIIIPFFAFAQHDYSAGTKSETEHGYSHHASAFLGATSGVFENAATGFTIGLEYEYIFGSTSPLMGIGGLFEAVIFEETEYVLGIPIFIHPYKGFKFFVSPNMLFREEGEINRKDNEIVGENLIESSNKFFIRMGAGYDFHFDNFALTPSVSFDLIEAKSYLVYGINFGILF